MHPTLAVIDPRTGREDCRIPDQDPAQVAEVAAGLRRHQAAWQEAGLAARCQALVRWREAIARHAPALRTALAVDTGRFRMAEFEVQGTLQRIERWAERAPRILAELPHGASGMVPSVAYRYHLHPYPLVGVIGPWNVPLTLALIDAIPALLAGAAVLLKPSEVTPRFAGPLADSVSEVPELAAVLGIVTGGPDTGRALVDQVDAVCFTGSVATGREVALQAARNFIPAFLELGGKDPAIVLASADLDNAVNAILRSAAGLTGQACQSLERIYVHRSIFEPFLERLVARASEVQINWPDLHAGQLGPFIFRPQAEKVQSQVDEAVAAGAQVHCGGEVIERDGGYWYLPTVMTGVSHDMRLMQEETFGPVLPVMPFDEVDEAIALANDSAYGLSGAVFAGSREEGEGIAVQLRAGAVSVNDASLTVSVHDVEKNAFCKSGMGASRMGDAGFLRFFRKQAILYQSAPAAGIDSFEESQTAPPPGD